VKPSIDEVLPQQNPEFVRETFSRISPRYDLANHLLSGGLDFLWRGRAAKIVAGWNPKRVLDLATGSGDLAITIQKACPDARVIGADFCLPMLEKARAKGFSDLVQADALHLPFGDGSFDVITVAFGLRNMASWSAALTEMSRVLTPHGHLLVLDFSLPKHAWLKSIYRLYLHHVLPRIAGGVTGSKSAYDYLGESIEKFPSGPAMLRLMEENGFHDAAAHPLAAGITSIYTAARKATAQH